MNNETNQYQETNHYVYEWKYPPHVNEGVVFYVGQGKHDKNSKYKRSRAIHYQDRKRRKSYAQQVFDKIIRSGDEPIISIYADDLTAEQANSIEKALILEYGRRNINTGILCNLTSGGEINPMNDPAIRLKQLNAVRCQEHRSARSISATEINARPELIQLHTENSKKMWSDSNFKKKMLEKHNSPEMLEKHRKVQSEISGTKVSFNGIEYRSKHELSRFLGISFQCLSNRLKNNIPLDAPKNFRRSSDHTKHF